MSHINGVLFAFTNKLREIGKPMQELHIINIILSSLPESYARARSNWNTIPVAERTVINLTGKLKAEEKIIACYSKPVQTEIAFLAAGQNDNATQNTTGQASNSRHTNSHNKYEGRGNFHKVKRGRVEKHRDGRRVNFNPQGFSYKTPNPDSSSTPAEKADREFDCLFCELYTHKTKDCNKMSRAKQASQHK
uniref:Uncharacterized protein n=1 Tax=Daphnia galeata TaxID=27404 RepID=A0A8J2RRU1_9CRUS|nr:unnamed protein product [Daphnia galeata]